MLMLRNKKERSPDRSFFAVCLNWACAEWRIENGEWKMNAMAECWPLRLNVCKSLETVRRGRTHGSFSCPSGNSLSVAPAESKPYVQRYAVCELRIFYEINAMVTRLPYPFWITQPSGRHLRNTRQCTTKFHKQNRHIRRKTSVCAGFRLQLRKILVSQLQIVRKQRPQPFFAAGTVPRYRRWTDPKPFSALFAG